MTSHLLGFWVSSRLRMMHLVLLGAVCFVHLLSLHQQAYADYQNAAFVENPTPTEFSAVGNMINYSQLNPRGDLTAKILVKADAGVAGRVTEVTAFLKLRNVDWETTPLSGENWGYHKNYANERKQTIDSTVSVRIPANELTQWMAAQCNALVERLQGEGLSQREIWGQDRQIRIGATLGFGVGFTAPRGMHSQEVKPIPPPNVTLTCRQFAGAQGPSMGGIGSQEPIIRVEGARLEHSVIAGQSGVCRIYLDYAVRTNLPNLVVKFRLKDDKGRSSEVKTLTTNALKIANGSVSYDIPNEVGAEIGKIRMHGVSPEFFSNQIEYRVVCHTPPAGGLTTTQGASSQAIQKNKLSVPALRDGLRQNRSSEGRQRIRSRGVDSLPPVVIPEPEPPALPNFELEGNRP